MDPFITIASRVLHAERITEAARRRDHWGADESVPAPEGDTWLGRLARLLTPAPLREHRRPVGKNAAI